MTGVTLADVAERAGVSVGLVSRVLRDDPGLRIRPETRRRILDVVSELDYVPNHAARSLRLARQGNLGVIVPNLTNPIFAEIIRGVETTASANGHSVVLGRSEWFAEHPDGLDRLFAERRVDGALVQGTDRGDDALMRRLLASDQPLVLINTVRVGLRGSVLFDDVAAAHLATTHLAELGHERIGLIGGSRANAIAQRRAQGFHAAMKEAGLAVPRGAVLTVGHSLEAGLLGFPQLVKRGLTGIVASNLTAAVGALTSAREHGVRVPEEVSVLGIHDAWFAAHTEPALTTVVTPLFDLGRVGVEQLLARLAGEEATDVVVSEPAPRLNLRRSTAPAP